MDTEKPMIEGGKKAKDEPERETWDKKIDFFLSCIGYAVGLGNIWRFPYLCYRNGGGAFLVPYLIFLLICGIPLFFLELSLGQFGALGPVSIWKVCPMFKGVGYCMIIISFVVCVYYNVIIAYSLHFIVNSFTSTLPWSTCNNDWNTDYCRDKSFNSTISSPPEWTGVNCSKGFGWFDGNGQTNVSADNLNAVLYLNRSDWANTTEINGSCVEFKTASQEYFTYKVLRLTEGIEVTGNMQWELFGFLVLAWVIVFFCLFKGVKWSGKVVYFTATFPYVVLLILLIRGAMEEGAYKGVEYYITPNITKLGDIRVWSDAAVQIFYSLGAAWGVLLSYSSLNKFNNNVYRDALSICAINCGTSILAGFVVFSVLGALAHQTGRDVADVVDQGAGLAFVAYPAAVANLPFAPIWAFLFFFMLLNLGLDSQFGMIEAVVNGLFDEFPIFRKNRVKFLAAMCFIQLILAIPMVTESGMYWVTLIDWYASGFSLMIAAVCEIGCIAWVYGVKRFLYDIECMIGYKPALWQWWWFAWMIMTPLTIVLLMITHLAFYSPATYNGVAFPSWAEALGWLSAMLSILSIPGWAVYQILYHPRAKGTFTERVRELLKCDPDWGPRDPKIKYKYRHTENVEPKELINISKKSENDDDSTTSKTSDPPSYNSDV
uniref:Transporter n=1 Tax=Phallusia mammillata TaxID=59560 RepID=A0A6F9DTK4_9ASCI|nr:sodium- and chloride-dependent GABA transporter 1 [Phallusia mammillata]